MAISTAAALIGSAVIGAGASYASSKSATKAASNAANYAADQNAQVNREIYNQTRTDLAPYNQAGQAGLAALMTRLGLGSAPTAGAGMTNAPANANGVTTSGVPSGTGTSVMYGLASGGAQPAATNWADYGAANPDVQAEWGRIQQTGNAGAFNNDPNAYYAWHYQTYGQPEGRALPGAQPQPPAQPEQPVQSPMTPQQEAAQFGTRPEDIAAPTYQRGVDMAAPGAFSYTPQDIENDPGFKFALKQGLDAVNASFAARGKLRGGDTMKALQDRGTGVAHQFDNDFFARARDTYNINNDNYRFAQGRQDRNFLDDRSVGLNLWNQQQARRDNIFSEDRGFNRSVYDQGTANLFNVVGIGQGAAAGAANAGNVFANNAIANNNARANTTANAAIAGAQNTSNLFGSALGAVGTYYGLRGAGGGGASFPTTYSI